MSFEPGSHLNLRQVQISIRNTRRCSKALWRLIFKPPVSTMTNLKMAVLLLVPAPASRVLARELIGGKAIIWLDIWKSGSQRMDSLPSISWS